MNRIYVVYEGVQYERDWVVYVTKDKQEAESKCWARYLSSKDSLVDYWCVKSYEIGADEVDYKLELILENEEERVMGV